MKGDAIFMKDVISAIWIETFQGIGEEGSSHFIETKPDTGILGTIKQLSAEQVSKNINGSSIASHIHHTMYHIDTSLSYLDDVRPDVDWSISWNIGPLTENEWTELKNNIDHSYGKMLNYMESMSIDNFTLRFFLSSLSHAAYHLGAIRQMIKAL